MPKSKKPVPPPAVEPAETPEPEPAAVAEAPPPEPWTPARVTEWNAYYDLYVAGFVILLTFLGSANKIQSINSGLWSLLEAGRQMVASSSPAVTDTITMAGQGSRWVNVPWLFELSHYALFSGVAGVVPPPEPGTLAVPGQAAGEQFAAAALIALNALVRGLTAFLLLRLVRKGPGLWWASICVAMALGVTIGPATVESAVQGAGGDVVRTIRPSLAIAPGGIAGPGSVAPTTWGLLFLAIELLLIRGASASGRAGRLYALIPLFLVWANLDESFAFGLVALAAWTVGRARDDRGRGSARLLRPALIALGLGFAATFINPSHAFGVSAGFGTILRSVGIYLLPPSPEPISPFSAAFEGIGAEFARSYRLYFATLVGLGLASFALNRRNFSLSRFLVFAAAAVLWGLALNFTAMFAVVFASTLALNGQEWYHDAVGTEGRLGAGWVGFSTGGRLVTLAVLFAATARGITGWGGEVGETQFGFGFNPDDFTFEAAEALRDAPIQGNVLNTSLDQGDAIAWRAGSKRKAFVDSRLHLYPRAVFAELDALRFALRDDAVERWQPVLDRYGISVVMLRYGEGRRTFTKLSLSPNWIPFYDDGAVTLFGRADSRAPAEDLAYFRANRLDADALAYRRPRAVRPWQRPPAFTSELLDSVFRNRLLNRPQPHTEAASRWLSPVTVPPGTRYLPDPAHCILAIREARTALSLKPDDPTAFRMLLDAYRLLLGQESALLAGIPLTPENIPRIVQAPQQMRVLAPRTRQLLTAMNFAIQTLPPPRTLAERVEKADLNFGLAQIHLQNNAFDLARDRLLAIEPRAGEMNDEFLMNLSKQLVELSKRVTQVQDQLNDMVINRRASPLEKATFARSQGCPGLAIHELEVASDVGGNASGFLPMLVDLYSDTGQPDKAYDLIGSLGIDDPSLSTGVGTASYRQGRIYFLLGSYEDASVFWRDKSISQLRTQRGMLAPAAGRRLLDGDALGATRMFLDLPEKVDLQAEWEFELGLDALEGGLSAEVAADHLQAALKLEPNLSLRPVIAYYLEKLGKPVPPPRTPPTPAAEPTPTPTLAPTPTPTPVPPGELPENVFEPSA